jgi:ubiquinone/menaquinone biosynthesis C-methylase UbiE
MNFDYKSYWEKRAKNNVASGDLNLAAVCYYGMPNWYNTFFGYFHKKAFIDMRRVVKSNVEKMLEVGCGTGRISRFMASKEPNTDVNGYGIDISVDMLKRAKRNFIGGSFARMSATDLHFQNEIFDLVFSSTVIQHIPYDDQEKAIKEICRVTKKNGYVIILELCDLDDEASHVFPRTKKDWIFSFQKNGCEYIKSKNLEFTPLLNLLSSITSRLPIGKAHKRCLEVQRTHSASSNRKVDQIYLALLKLVIYCSYPTEYLLYRLDISKGRHCAIVFKKS